MYPSLFEDLVIAFGRLPGVGTKTAERYAYAVLDWDPDVLDTFIQSVKGIKKIKHCKICGNLSDSDICSICSDTNRDQNMICVVQNPKNLYTIENMNSYHGVYHILNGLINPQKGILPDHLNINKLENRISENTKEIILALDPNIAGETTSLYIEKLLGDHVKISRLAYGIPVGGQLDYADAKTLEKAFEGRK